MSINIVPGKSMTPSEDAEETSHGLIEYIQVIPCVSGLSFDTRSRRSSRATSTSNRRLIIIDGKAGIATWLKLPDQVTRASIEPEGIRANPIQAQL
jgi:hypothetical protein